MTTLESIHANDLVVILISALTTFVLYLLYCAVKNKDINFKVLIVAMIIVSAVSVPLQNYYYSSAKREILNRFASDNDIVCKFNKNSNIIISQKKGYKLKDGFFIKDDMAVKLGSCYLIE